MLVNCYEKLVPIVISTLQKYLSGNVKKESTFIRRDYRLYVTTIEVYKCESFQVCLSI